MALNGRRVLNPLVQVAAMVALVACVSVAAGFAWLSPLRSHATLRTEAVG